jgi:predicted DNA repair protein MutK
VTPTVIDAVAGVIVGAVVLLGISIVQRLRGKTD